MRNKKKPENKKELRLVGKIKKFIISQQYYISLVLKPHIIL